MLVSSSTDSATLVPGCVLVDLVILDVKGCFGGHTKALAYVPSTPKSSTGGFESACPAAAAYVRTAGVIRGAALLATAKAGRAILEDIIMILCS